MTFRSFAAPTARIGLVAALSLTSIGCGFLFSHGPPDVHLQLASFSCTEADAGPIIDLVWAGLNVLGAAAAAADPGGYENSSQIVAVGLSWGALSTFAGVTGVNKSKRCREAKRQLAERQALEHPSLAPPGSSAQTVQSVVVEPDSDTLAVGARRQLVATAYASNGATVPNRMFAWSSSNDAIASVSNAGLVIARARGTVVIAANTGNVVGTASIVVSTGQ